MVEENALVPKEIADQQLANAGDLDDIFKGGDYLGRVQLMTASCKSCKAGTFPINHYAYILDKSEQDMGETIDMLPIAIRAKAMDVNDEVITSFDKECELFKRIVVDSDVKDSGCMFGPEFLVYVPALEKFATVFCGSKSFRREARALRNMLTKPVTLSSKLVETKRYSWQTPVCTSCQTPFDVPGSDELSENIEKFMNEKGTDVEEAPTEERER